MKLFSNKKELSGDRAITEGVIWKQLLLFFFPILFGTFFQQLYNTVDAIVVGKYVGKEALAAVGGSTGNMINLIVGFFVGLASGATVIIAQFYGARNGRDVSRTVHTAIALCIAAGAIMTVFGYIFTPQLLALMDTPTDVMPYAIDYMRIYFLGMIPSLIYNIGSGILRAVGDSKRPLLFLIAACLINIVLDVLFVMGLDMDVIGAALATILSQLISAILVLITLARSRKEYRLEFRKIRFHRDIFSSIIRIGLPAGLRSVMYSISNVIIQTSINGFGTDILAGWTAYGKMDGLFWMTINAFGIAITTFVGQNFGAGKFDRMRKSIRTCFVMTTVATLVMSAVVYLLSDPLLHMFSDEEQVIEWGKVIVKAIVPTYFTYICIELFSGALQGAGDTLVPTIITLTGICLFRTVWVLWYVPAHHELEILLASYPITWVISSILFTIYYFKGNWFGRCLKKAGIAPPENGWRSPRKHAKA